LRKKVLGRGLEALLSQDMMESVSEREKIIELAIDRISYNPYQPRDSFDERRLKELASSIKRNGIIQPVVVRRKNDNYELVVGERRLRATRIAGKESIPAVVRELEEEDSLKLALMENLQREDLNPLEEARGYRMLKKRFGYSDHEIGGLLGKNRSTVANTLRLLKLPDEVKKLLESGKISAGHARAILSIEGDKAKIEWARKVARDNVNVRQLEREVSEKKGPSVRKHRQMDPHLSALKDALERHLGTKVGIRVRKKGGEITVHYYTEEGLEGILERMGLDLEL
jgi:ParB family chromosome partitioning protein